MKLSIFLAFTSQLSCITLCTLVCNAYACANRLSSAVPLTSGVEYTGHQPAWFRKEHDPYTSQYLHVYTGEYWPARQRQDWHRCPDIF